MFILLAGATQTEIKIKIFDSLTQDLLNFMFFLTSHFITFLNIEIRIGKKTKRKKQQQQQKQTVNAYVIFPAS